MYGLERNCTIPQEETGILIFPLGFLGDASIALHM